MGPGHTAAAMDDRTRGARVLSGVLRDATRPDVRAPCPGRAWAVPRSERQSVLGRQRVAAGVDDQAAARADAGDLSRGATKVAASLARRRFACGGRAVDLIRARPRGVARLRDPRAAAR